MVVHKIKGPTKLFGSSVITVGAFDGIHLAHQAILKRVKSVSHKLGSPAVLLTFDPHPTALLNPPIGLLTPIEEKITILRNLDLTQNVVILEFTRELAKLEPEEFVRLYLVESLGARLVVEGQDHTFGFNAQGSVALLKELSRKYNFELEILPPVFAGTKEIKSGRIRELIKKGEIKKANEMLGREYTLYGTVVEGDKLGRKLGFPTANIKPERDKLLPPDGVYLVRTKLASEVLYGLLYIGSRPTLGTTERRVELNIFDFDGNLYGENLLIEFITKIRSDMKFERLNELKKQMGIDKAIAVKLLQKITEEVFNA